ncbi:aspartyl protease family protein [Gracilimonas mengyeensis]|uniref:Aspartyl protease n=1 Tax=Gracilimonas mengyeensis TaxID=1302730 RepID=A0A521CFG1_9BACT|nr:aspartyl protease family protein [Gracilimonas mengyeensis]SMO58183.1 Aspartyl protease [Gracilimonas mengyeensis]
MDISNYLLLLLIWTLAFGVIRGQEKSSKEKLVDRIVQSINNQSMEGLKPYLSDDFVISGRYSPISLKILEQLILQLNEQVNDYTWIKSEETLDGSVTHFYRFDYEGMGERQMSFSVNEDGKITEMELVNMKVKTLEEEPEVIKPTEKVIEIPFRLKEKLLLVDATIQGERKTFLFDSGSPRLILNQQHFSTEATDSGATRFSSVEGVHRHINSLDIIELPDFNFHGIRMKNQQVLTADLSHLEATLHTPIVGLIGYEIFEGYDVLFNYGQQKLILIYPDQTKNFIAALSAQLSVSVIPFKLESHLPLFEASASGRQFTLGLDSGASSNLLSLNLIEPLEGSVSELHHTELSGADTNEQMVTKGVLDEIGIGDISYFSVPTIFKDITNLKKAYGDELEGLAGYELLSRQVSLISYSENTLYLFK